MPPLAPVSTPAARSLALLHAMTQLLDTDKGYSSVDVGLSCITAAQSLTGAAFGFFGQLDPASGKLAPLATNDTAAATSTPPAMSCRLCRDRAPDATPRACDEWPPCARSAASAPAEISGAAPAMLGARLQRDGTIIGIIGVCGRDEGFGAAERSALDALAPAIAQAFHARQLADALAASDREAARQQRRLDVLLRLLPAGIALADARGKIQRAKRAEVREREVLAESRHGMRNAFAILRAIVARTCTGAVGEETIGKLMSRIEALSRAQALLAGTRAGDIDLESIVHEELLATAARDVATVLPGPSVQLGRKAAEVLLLALHELGCNAIEHGALSTVHGRITIRWQTIRRDGRRWLAFDWCESGLLGQATAFVPGFGHEVLTRKLPYELGGECRFVPAETGYAVHLGFPLES